MKKIIRTFVFCLIPVGVFGQLNPITDQYILNPLTINPAYAGSRGALNISAFYRKQWVGITGAPETITLTADAPFFDKKVGFGLIITSDKIGVTKENQIITNYAYKINFKKGVLSFGLGAGITTSNTAWSDLVVLDPGDELYMTGSHLFIIPNFSFGTYFSGKNFFAGFSIPKFLGYKFNYDKNKYMVMIDPAQYNFLFNIGYIYSVSEKIKLLPSALLTLTPHRKALLDINANISYADRFWLGLSLRTSRSVAGLFQFQINSQLKIAYIYDIDTGQIGKYSNGSHEIMLRYEFKYKTDMVNPLIF